MPTDVARPTWGTSHRLLDRVVLTIEKFLHIEAVSGGVLILAALIALLWVNSPFAYSYHQLWHTMVTVGVGSWTATQSLHFLVNEGLMTIFFLVAGLEIRRELYEGALSNIRLATLPLAAAVGGVVMPAIIYLGFNSDEATRQGWAVPIATDIAFAVGILALLGSAIPRGVRVLLLALAIIDDVIAVLVIAIFYSHDLRMDGAVIAGAAVAVVILFQRLGIRSAIVYLFPGAVLWFGLWRLGVHPTLAGVILGLLTPAVAVTDRSGAPAFVRKLIDMWRWVGEQEVDDRQLVESLRQANSAQLDMIPPVVRVEATLHPWVAYGVMPLFALANAGVSIDGASIFSPASAAVTLGIGLGLLLGKPLGILLASFITIRMRWCELPEDVGWKGLSLVAFLGGIGFTMSIFIAMLAYESEQTLATAKLAILLASGAAAAVALVSGRLMFRRGADSVTEAQMLPEQTDR